MSALSLETFDELPEACRSCVRWELGEEGTSSAGADARTFEKEAWLSRLLLTWPAAGRVASIGDRPAGYVLVAPPEAVARSTALPTSPVSRDAALLVTARVADWARGAGIGRMLVQGVAKDLTRRGFTALELFGARGDTRAGHDAAGDTPPTGTDPDEPDEAWGTACWTSLTPCIVPSAFAEAVGFTVVAEHPHVPRLRMELRSALDWREDVEAALDRLFRSMTLTSR